MTRLMEANRELSGRYGDYRKNQVSIDALSEIVREVREPAAAGILVEALGERSTGIRQLAAMALGSIQEERVLATVEAALDEEDYFIKKAAIRSPGRLRHRPSEKRLGEILLETGGAESPDGVSLNDVCHRAAYALADIGGAEAAGYLLEALGDRDAGIRNTCITSLRTIGKTLEDTPPGQEDRQDAPVGEMSRYPSSSPHSPTKSRRDKKCVAPRQRPFYTFSPGACRRPARNTTGCRVGPPPLTMHGEGGCENMGNMILQMPLWLSIALFITISGGLVALILVLIRRSVAHEKLKQNNEVAGFNYAVLGAVYSMLLAFMTMAIYEEFKQGRATIQNETASLIALHRYAGAFAEPHRSELRNELRDYTRSVIRDEWPLLQHGEESPRTRELAARIWTSCLKYAPHREYEKAVHAESLSVLGDFQSARHHRMLSSQTLIPGFMWFVLILGAVFTIAYPFFFGSLNLKAQITMTAMMAILISMILLLIVHLDNPFNGPISVEKEPLLNALKVMEAPSR